MATAGTRSGSAESSKWVTLLSRIAQRDQEALGQLYDATSARLFGLICSVVHDEATAEEIMLDVYSQVWRIAPAYAPEKGSPLTWLFLLGRSRAIDHLRSRIRRSREKEHPIEAAFAHSHPDPDPETSILSESRRTMVLSALKGLSSEQREVVRLAFFEGLTHLEIAEHTGVPLGTIKTRIRLGMLHMRESLKDQVGTY